MTMTLANLVSVECSASCARRGADQRAFLSASEAANARTGQGCSGYRYLISVLLPESARMMAAVALLPGRAWNGESQNHEHQHYDKKLFHNCTSNWKLPGLLSQ
jgi:hypothetical protein